MNDNDSSQVSSVSETAPQYENNPFFVATNGLDLLFKSAQSIGIMLAIIAGLSLLSSVPSYFAPDTAKQPQTSDNAALQPNEANFVSAISNIPAEVWTLGAVAILVILTIFVLISTVIKGVIDVTSAHIAHNKTITISQALREVFANFWGYLWVQVVLSVKVFLWTLLFIIPGIIMSVRYSLAGVTYFDKRLKGNESVKHSAQITKGAWLTTFASQNLLNLITLGFIQPLLVPGTNAVLYSQLTEAGEKKPKAHPLSWLTFFLFLILGLIIFSLALFLFWALANYSRAV